jgi:predicted acylesterase/phospholipase RssA
VTGAVYEIGALRALDDTLANFSVNDFDIYVGTSAGSLVASYVANGLKPREMMRHLERPVDGLAPLHLNDLFTLDALNVLQRSLRFPEAVLNIMRRTVLSWGRISLLDVIEMMAMAIPSGLYDSLSLERYLAATFANRGMTNSFADLKAPLAIIATDLDTGERVIFGEPPLDQVPISWAVAASSALPLVYRPVRIGDHDYIDGGIRGTASIDLAIERGADLIICVNPLVPYDHIHFSQHTHVRDLGAPGVANQVFRTVFYAGLHYHIKQLQRRYPDVDIVLIEPERNDVRMFSEMPMRYASRVEVARHGFESVAAALHAQYDRYAELFGRHGIRLERRKTVRRMATVVHNLNEPAGKQNLRKTLGDLKGVLDRLDHSTSV